MSGHIILICFCPYNFTTHWFILALQCHHHETAVGDILISLPHLSRVREHHLDDRMISMDQSCVKGRAVHCRQNGGTGLHLVQLYNHMKYKPPGGQVRSMFTTYIRNYRSFVLHQILLPSIQEKYGTLGAVFRMTSTSEVTMLLVPLEPLPRS